MDIDDLLDPELAAALAAMPPFGPITADNLPQIRAQRALLLQDVELSDAVERTDHTFPGLAGGPEVTVRVHRPKKGDGPLPCIYWVHGGGYIIGSYEMEDLRFDRWCQSLNCVGVAVEYRLAPETPYPGPLDDCYAGLVRTFEHAEELGIDRERLGIGGASAGGGLAAGLALLARDRGEVPVAFQLLVYPMIDDRMETVSSSWDVPVWPPASNRFGWDSYLGNLAGGKAPAYAVPARATDLAGLPPAFIMVGTLDGFHDEDVAYAQRLNHASVHCELHVYPGAPHGFDGFVPDARISKAARRTMREWLARRMER